MEKRYQLEWQPIAIPLEPAKELHYIRELTRPTRVLWTAFDALAIETINKMLTDSVVVGVEVSLFCCLVFWRINGLVSFVHTASSSALLGLCKGGCNKSTAGFHPMLTPVPSSGTECDSHGPYAVHANTSSSAGCWGTRYRCSAIHLCGFTTTRHLYTSSILARAFCTSRPSCVRLLRVWLGSWWMLLM
jgi:hypothetical protein